MWKCEEETLYNFQVQEGCAVAEESLKKGNKICGKNVYKKRNKICGREFEKMETRSAEACFKKRKQDLQTHLDLVKHQNISFTTRAASALTVE